MKHQNRDRILLCAGMFLGVALSNPLDAEGIEVPVPVHLGWKVELIASEPAICTPTAVQVGKDGRVWVLENHTHSRPKTYQGPETDRVLVFGGFDASGQARECRVYAEGFRDGMGLLLLENGDLVVSTRGSVLRFLDRDGDGRAEEKKTLMTLTTEDAYPHNALSGVARDASGRLWVGLGENHGMAWEMRGADGRTIWGSDEGGVFAMDTDGKGLEWWALGIWNPFGLSFGPDGELFAVDNDPAGGSLSRLLHIVPGGDYGYRYRYGRTTRHPFVSWFGTRLGTLPPVCLVGEAPTGLIHFQSDALGAENAGQLLAATWTEHGVQRLPLKRRGVSYASSPEWVVRGGHYFRPTGLAEAPDGSLVISDWADPAYEVHGKGRIWRLRGTKESERQKKAESVVAEGDRGREEAEDREIYQKLLEGTASLKEARRGLERRDPFVYRAAILALAKQAPETLQAAIRSESDPQVRLGLVLSLRMHGQGAGDALLESFLKDPNEAVRRAALQWIADEKLGGWEGRMEAVLDGNVSRETFQSYLAAAELLRPGKPDPRLTADVLGRMALATGRAPAIRALALRMMVPWLPSLQTADLAKLSAEADATVALEATRILAERREPAAVEALKGIAENARSSGELKLEAVAGLAGAASEEAVRVLLEGLSADKNAKLSKEATRSLGRIAEGWESASRIPSHEVLQVRGDAAAGRRLFYHPNGPGCSVCHVVEGRGGAVGPDLTDSHQMPAERLLESIREPSREVAPAFGTWRVQMKDGAHYLGIDLFEDNKKLMTLVDATGTKHKLAFTEMTEREPVPVSLMPPRLDARMSLDELRDLMAFLMESR